LLAVLRYIGIELKAVGAGQVPVIVLGVVAPLHGAALFTIEPHREAFVVEQEQVAFADDLGGWQFYLARARGQWLFKFQAAVTVATGTGGKGNAEKQRD